MQVIFLFLVFMITFMPLMFEVMGFDEIEQVERGLFKIFS